MNKTTDIFVDLEVNKQDSPERSLFLSVILQALLDATSNKKGTHKKRAIAWFFCSAGVTCDNFEMVCHNAEMSSSFTRSFAYKVIYSSNVKYVRQRIKKML